MPEAKLASNLDQTQAAAPRSASCTTLGAAQKPSSVPEAAMAEVPEDPSSGLLKDVRDLLVSLQPKPPVTLLERLYARAATIAKYVGIPELIIAAIGPVKNLASLSVEAHHKHFIETTCLNYTTELLDAGEIDRASKLVTTYEGQKDFNSRLQYYKAKVLVSSAIRQGRNYTEAYDVARILERRAPLDSTTLYVRS